MKTNLLEQNQKPSRKGLGIILTVTACAVALAALTGGYQAAHTAQTDQAAMAHITTLIAHRDYLHEQDVALGQLIEEGMQNQIAITGTLAAISSAMALYQVAKPIVEGIAKVWANVVWGDNVTVKTINPEKIDAAFNDSQVFMAEIKKRFPKSYENIMKTRQDMKQYQFDLSGLINDLQLMTDSTINGINKTQSALNLRQTKLNKKGLTSAVDLKIWKQVIKKQTEELAHSIEQCDMIIKNLVSLQKNTKRAKDDLDNHLAGLQQTLTANNQKLKQKLADIEEKMKHVGCINDSRELLRAIFTLGISCAFDSNTKKRMENIKVDLREEQTIIQALDKRMDFFDDLKSAADTLVSESEGVLQTTKAYKQSLVQTKTMLDRDFKPTDIDENMGDIDFANDFATLLYDALEELKIESEKVGQSCIDRKHKLDNALTQIEKYAEKGTQ